jgi:hypothetical protein
MPPDWAWDSARSHRKNVTLFVKIPTTAGRLNDPLDPRSVDCY